jgi:hypothetical protein
MFSGSGEKKTCSRQRNMKAVASATQKRGSVPMSAARCGAGQPILRVRRLLFKPNAKLRNPVRLRTLSVLRGLPSELVTREIEIEIAVSVVRLRFSTIRS